TAHFGIGMAFSTFAAGEGQLVAFSRFVGGDPFVQLVDVPAESEETAAQESASGGGGGEPQAPSSGDGVAEGAPALIEINGELESVEVDGTFPADDPAFRLVATTEDAVEFGLVEGSFSSGIDTLDLEVGKSITLVSQPDGFRFTIKLIGFPAEFQGPEPAVTATEQP
ncbi:MAG: hypothetical protein ACE5EV_07750, partial [Gaiellales bacterium]